MFESFFSVIAGSTHLKIVLGAIILLQLIISLGLIVPQLASKRPSSQLATAAVIDTVVLTDNQTADTKCNGGQVSYQVSSDQKQVEVFCMASVSPEPTPSVLPSPSPSPSFSPVPSSSPNAGVTTPANFKVAFTGDSGGNSAQYNFDQVLELIRSEEAQLVLHQGDMGYDDSASQWEQTIIDHLDTPSGSTFPYFMSDGNHDSWSDYAPIVVRRAEANGLGTPEISADGNYTMTYKGLKMVFNKEGGDTAYTQQALADDSQLWKVCSWHHNRNDFQPGGKSDDVAFSTFQSCLDAGAIIAMGHEHSYGRSCSITDFTGSDTNYGADCSDPRSHTIIPGESTFFFVSGMGGKEIRDYHDSEHDDDGWWASIYTSNRYCKYTCTKPDQSGQDKSGDLSPGVPNGVTFITFNVDGDPRKAKGYTKMTDGTVIDEWTVYSQN